MITRDHAHNARSPSQGAEERYRLVDQADIKATLIQLARGRNLVSASFNGGTEYLMTAVVGVNDPLGLLLLDFGPDAAHTRRAIASGRLQCSVRCAGVPIHFTCESLRGARFEGMPTIAAAMPQRIYRIQRRDAFRAATPIVNGPRLLVPDPLTGHRHTLALRDISLGGVGLIGGEGGQPLQPSARYANCTLSLPEFGDITVDLRICHHWQQEDGGRNGRDHYGAAFDGLAARDYALLQRYVYRLQHGARSR